MLCVLFLANCPADRLAAQTKVETAGRVHKLTDDNHSETQSSDSDKSPKAKKDIWSEAEKPIRVERNLVFRKIDGQEIKADLFRPADEAIHPLVLMVHGGAWSAGDKWDLLDHGRELAQAGFVAFSINYRLAPKAKMADQLSDVQFAAKYALEHAKTWHADSERFAIWGYSAGAHLGSLLALMPQENAKPLNVDAVVAGGAPSDFEFVPKKSLILAHVMGGSRISKPEVYKRYSPIEYISKTSPPFFFFHGNRDLLVPQAISLRMHERLLKLGAESSYHVVDGKGHLFSFLDMESRRKAIKFLKQHLSSEAKEKH